jgi:hypothetical protein
MSETLTESTLTAHGKVLSYADGFVIFAPTGTNYELKLAAAGYSGAIKLPIKAIIRATARKVYTVPSGGNFITPIFGPPRIVQGRVRLADERSLVVHAGCAIHIELPAADDAIDLTNGPIAVGRMVNVICLPGARFELA